MDELQPLLDIDEAGWKVLDASKADYKKNPKEISSATNQAVENFIDLCNKYGFTMSYTLNH